MDIDPLCAERCAYGTCMAARTMYGCGGCCGCLGGCQVAYENEGASQFAAARLFAFMDAEKATQHFRTEPERRIPTLDELARRNA